MIDLKTVFPKIVDISKVKTDWTKYFDFIFTQSSFVKANLLIFFQDELVLLSQSHLDNLTAPVDKWKILKRIDKVLNLDYHQIKNVKMMESVNARIFFVLNGKYVVSRGKFRCEELERAQDTNKEKISVLAMFSTFHSMVFVLF
jgi:hypothetical protein